jgi:hypothetical protein
MFLMNLTLPSWNQKGSWEEKHTGEGRTSLTLLAKFVLQLGLYSIYSEANEEVMTFRIHFFFLTKSSLVPEAYADFLFQDSLMLIIMMICGTHLTFSNYKYSGYLA